MVKKVKKGLTKPHLTYTIGSQPAGSKPYTHPRLPTVPLTVRKLPPCWFPGGGFLCPDTGRPLMVRKITCMANLKNTKMMSGLHSKWQGGPVALACPHTGQIYFLFVIIAETLSPANRDQTPRT